MLLRTIAASAAAALLAAAVVVPNLSGGGASTQDDALSKADKAFEEKTYSAALDLYRKAAADAAFAKSHDRVAVRVGECLARLNRGDEARDALAAYAKSKPGTRGARLALIERGVVTLTMPHYYYEKDGKRSRGEWVQGGTYVWTEYDDQIDGTRDLETARVLGIKHAAEGGAAWTEDDARAHVRGLLELAAGLEQLAARNVAIDDERVDAADPAYGALRKWKDRMFVAFDEAVANAAARADKQGEALALYLKAAAARRVLGNHRVAAGRFEIQEPDEETFKPLPPERDPLVISALAREKARGLPTEDAFVFALGKNREEFERYVDALKAYEVLVASFPKSTFVGDGKAAVERLTFPRLQIYGVASVPPKKPTTMNATSRNIATATIGVYRFDAKRVWQDESFLRDEDNRINSIDDLVKESGWRPKDSDRVFEFAAPTGDTGERRPLSFTFEIPPLEAGAYVVRATTEGVENLAILNVSDLGLVVKHDRDTTLAYVAEGSTGKPVEGANVVFRERWRTRGLFGNWSWNEAHVRAKTDADGTAVHKRSEREARNATVEVLAVSGAHAAAAPESNVHSRRDSERAPSAYLMTDRPVYRPGDPVRVAAMISREEGENRVPFAAEIFGVEVRDPKNREVFKQELKTDGDGAFAFEIVLGQEPPLGKYSIVVRRGKSHVRRASFQVEEYLKPEFEVSIEGPKEELRLGDPAKATIVAEYYFGGGVAGGEVSWSVFREVWAPAFRRDEPWRNFYGEPTEYRGPARVAAGRELVASGTTSLSSDGRADISFETAKYANVEGEGSRFLVQAEVVDASRRTISGEGRVTVAKRALAFDLRPAKAFYVVGENVEVELQSVFSSGAPAAVKGVFKTSKIKPAVVDAQGRVRVEEERTELASFEGEADAKGVGFFRTVFDEAGYYAVRFEARDKFEQLCFGEVRFWVSAPTFRADGFAMKNLELIPERRTYTAGETARVLLHSDLPDCAVLLSVEADSTMFWTQVVRLTGKSALIEIPIVTGYAPNVHVHAVTVREGAFFEERLELFVPPVEKFTTTSLAFSKETYRPGEIGDLVVTTTNFKGEPVSARAVVTVLDASLFYIQGDETPDFRRFLYGTRRWPGVARRASAELNYGMLVAADVRFGEYDQHGTPPAWWVRSGVASGLFASKTLTTDDFLGWSDGSWGDGGPGLEKKRASLGMRSRGGVVADSAAPSARPGGGGGFDRGMDELKSEAEPEASMEAGLLDHSGDDAEAAEEPEFAVRSDFRDAAFWSAAVRTDAAGRATVRVPFPESTTHWRAKAWTWTPDVRVGEATTDARTTKTLVARLRTPRFFVEGDVVTVTASINNRGASALRTNVALDLGEGNLLSIDEGATRVVDAPAFGVGSVDWRVRVLRAGTAKLRLKAWSGDETDGLSREVPVFEWGAEKRLFEGAVFAADGASALTFEIPAERRAETTRVRVVVNPSLALTLVDALPYLIEYPYGCTEQTVSRFVPAAVVARTLREAGTTLDEVVGKRADLAKAAEQGVGRERRTHGYQLDDVVRAGLARLRALQRHDGGYGWWKEDDSNVYMTAYVLQGLVIARDADVAVDDGLISGCVKFLQRALPEERRLETAAFGAFALASAGAPAKDVADKVFKGRDGLSLYGKALLASALARGGRAADAALVVRGFDDFVKRDDANGTVHFGSNQGGWWWWWNSRVETNAAILHALMDVDSNHALAAPLAKWIALNRRGNRWTNTRDSAHAIFALVRYARATGELDPDMEVTIDLGGVAKKSFRIDRKNIFTFDGSLEICGDAVTSGKLVATVTAKGRGRCYVAAEAGFFTKEAEIASAGRELFVEREFVRVVADSKVVKVDGRDVTESTERFEPLASGAVLQSGDVVEVRLKVEAKNDYEHLLFEDMKPSGFEPIEVKSGGRYSRGICSNVEFRDEKTALFATWLEQGTHVLSYRLRAELPGELRAAPARGEAMYAPDVAGTSRSFRFEVRDKVESR